MNAYFFPVSNEERENILNKHKEVYSGYRTLNPNPVANEQPLYVQDFANDKGGLVVNNKGEVKAYTNMGINESRKRKPYLAKEEEELDEFFYFSDEEDPETVEKNKKERESELDMAMSTLDTDDELSESEHMCEQCGLKESLCECGGSMEEAECTECSNEGEVEEIEHRDLKKGGSYKMKMPKFTDDDDEEVEFEYTGPVNYEFGEPHYSFQRKDKTGGALLGKDLSRLYTEQSEFDSDEIEVGIDEIADDIMNSGRLEEVLSLLDMDEYSDEYEFVENLIDDLTWEYADEENYTDLQDYIKEMYGEKLYNMFERYLEGDEDWMIDMDDEEFDDEDMNDESDDEDMEDDEFIVTPDEELGEGSNILSNELDTPTFNNSYSYISGGPEQFSDDEGEPHDGYQDDIQNIQNMFDYQSQNDSDPEAREMIKNLNKQMNTDFDGDEPSNNESPAYNFISGGPPGVSVREDEELDEEEVEEKWSEKYKNSIDCNNPKGFSQKAHCQGKKKDAKEFNIFQDRFVAGASKFISPNQALDLWHDFEAHAGYSFNKSHAVAYSTLSYWTAWLKYYYPLEFMFALLKNEKDKDGRTEYLIEAKRMGISIKLPHINDSDLDFKIEGKGIRFGLTSIKYISNNIANKYIAARPFKSYKELEEFTFTKGNGVNSRALTAMRLIGAATFPDNPRNDAEIKENIYEYLNLPEFNITIPSHYYAFIQDVCDFEEKGSFILLGMAKAIKRGKGWSRVEILDKTGSVGISDEESTAIETGRTYLVLANDNRIVSAIPVDEIKGSPNALVRFLSYKQLPYTEEEMFVVSFKPRITKTGKKMASLTLADTSRDLHSVTVFPTAFPKAYMHIEEGKAYKFSFGKTKDGTVIMEDVNVS